MKASEAAVLLTKISAHDNREVTESAAVAWAEALPDVTLADALEVLPRYYRAAHRDSKTWVMPGDILFAVRDLFRLRLQDLCDKVREEATAGLSDDDDDVRATGWSVLAIGQRAVNKAKAEWLQAHPMPGEDVKSDEDRYLEKAGRYYNGVGGRRLELPEPTPTAESWAALMNAGAESGEVA